MKANFVLPEVTNLSGNYFYSKIPPIHAILFAGRGGLLFYGCLHRACPIRDSNDCLPGLKTQQSYLRKVKVSLFTWNRCSTTWRQRAWVSGQLLGWPRSRNATPRNEQVLWMINCFYFFADTLRNHQAKIFPLFWFQVYRDRRAAAGAVVDDHSSTSQKSWTYSHAGS